MLKLTAPFKLTKAPSDAGEFEGYAAIFGNVDLGGDVIEAGAFKEFARTPDDKILVLPLHSQSGFPIGKADVSQDDTGLRFTAQLVMEDPQARLAHAHMKAGTLTGMSIGYDILPGGAEIMESGVRRLTALKLWEISPVIWGMNPQARIDAVKARPRTVREFEKALRQIGFSDAEAVTLAAAFKSLTQPGDPGPRDSGIVDGIQRINDALSCVSVPKII